MKSYAGTGEGKKDYGYSDKMNMMLIKKELSAKGFDDIAIENIINKAESLETCRAFDLYMRSLKITYVVIAATRGVSTGAIWMNVKASRRTFIKSKDYAKFTETELRQMLR